MTSTRHNPLAPGRPTDGSASTSSASTSSATTSSAGTSTAGTSRADDGYLDAARDAILAVGWSRTTLTDIARRAGVSRMTLYRRWPDTQTLLADLMTREWGRVVREAAGPGSTITDPVGRITDAVVATVRGLRANQLLRRIVDVDPELLLPYLLDRRGRSQDLLATALSGLIARSLLLACHGFALSAHTMTDDPTRDADVTAYDAELVHLVERFLQP